jgi:hypothetical protein
MNKNNILQPVSNMRQIPINQEYKKFVEPDLQQGLKSGEVFVINVDVFEVVKLVHNIKSVIKHSDYKKTLIALRNSKKRWKECLKKVKGNYDKAVLLYENR